MTQTATQTDRPSLNAINEKTAIIELMLGDYGLHQEWIPATATEPAELVGIGVSYNEATNRIELATDRELLQSFAFDTDYNEFRRWMQVREAEALVF